VPADVLAYATRLLPVIAPGLAAPSSVRRAAGDLVVRRTDDPVAEAAAAVHAALDRDGSVGVIVADDVAGALATAGVQHAVLGDDGDKEFDVRVDVVPVSLAKGLEFDHVVVLELAAVVAGEGDSLTGLRRLYVCLTRAVTSLTVLHSRPLPPELAR